MKKFLDINGKAYKKELIQGIEKVDKFDTGFYRKRHDIKCYQIFKKLLGDEFVSRPEYCLILKYGTNQLKNVEGHREYSDFTGGEFWVHGYQKNDVSDIEYAYHSIEKRDKQYEKIYQELNNFN